MPVAQPKPKPRPVGRPKLAKGQAKGSILPVRFSPEDRAKVERAAKAESLSVSEWIRRTVHAAL
jgi:predicted HicB family RNase H-like nuclease